MNKPILSIQNISKQFTIGNNQEPYLSLRDSINKLFVTKKNSNTFWALQDISFDVMQGESIGIIGKNGAGKSTLLKILSKITPPSSGKIISRGRIASLLEVGTGFHPELSGRENVFMNGSILGMRKQEIEKNFDAIVDFSGVSKFIDTPLKHYSSGMQLRLAFAVAAFLENEILIIDEVLAVGDAEFQQKCMGKMSDISSSGRTVLFVSHNMAAVKRLCNKAVMLNKGKLQEIGTVDHVAQLYANSYSIGNNNTEISQHKSNPYFQIEAAEILTATNDMVEVIGIGTPWKIKLIIQVKQTIPHVEFGFGFKTIEDLSFRNSWSIPQDLSPGTYQIELLENEIHLGLGKYKINIGISSRKLNLLYIEDALVIQLDDLGEKLIAPRPDAGIVLNQHPINIIKI